MHKFTRVKNNMILSDRDIKKYLRKGKIIIIPKPNLKKQLGPSSLDLRLGNQFRTFDHIRKSVIDIENPEDFKKMTTLVKVKTNEHFVIQPGEFILGVTLEYICLSDDLTARIDGKSSLGRLGIVIHSTAGHVDPGFRGCLTLEMTNIGMMPVLLYPKMRICQLVFQTLTSKAEVPYNKKSNAKYQGAKSPQESKLEKEKL